MAEHEKGGDIANLNLPKATPYILPERKPVGRPRKDVEPIPEYSRAVPKPFDPTEHNSSIADSITGEPET